MRTRRALCVVAVTLGLVLAACGGGEDSSADPSASESPETESPSPSPTETEEAGPPKQPKGKHGVTYHIQNWDEYAEEPVVLAWKKAWEAAGGSMNKGEVVKDLLRRTRGQERREHVQFAQQMWEHNLHVKEVARVRVQDVRKRGGNARVIVCVWGPSVGLYQENGKQYQPQEPAWERLTSGMRKQGDKWQMASSQYGKNCQGGGS